MLMTPVIPSDAIAVRAVFNEMVEPAIVMLAPARSDDAEAAAHVYDDPLNVNDVFAVGVATGSVSV